MNAPQDASCARAAGSEHPEQLSRKPNAGGTWTLLPATAFHEHACMWDLLNDSGPRSPFLVSSFIHTLLTHFGQPDTRLALCKWSDQVVAMALLRPTGRLGWTCFQPSQLILAPIVHAGDAPIDDLARHLLAALPPATLSLSLTQLDPHITPRPSESDRVGTLDYIETCEISLTPGDFKHYEANLSKNALANLRKRANKAKRDYGDISLDVLDSSADVEPFLREYARIESAGWKAAGGTAIREESAQYDFYLDLLSRSAARNQVRMFRLRFGHRVAAMEAVLITHETALLLKTTHDEALRQYAPGQRLFYEILRWITDNLPTVRRVETYGPLNEKQRTFATATRRMYHLNAYRHRIVAAAHRLRIGLRQTGSASDASREVSTTAIYPHTAAAAFFGGSEWFALLRATVRLPGSYVEARTPVSPATGRSPFILPLQLVSSALGRQDLTACANFYSGLYAPIVEERIPGAHAASALHDLLRTIDWDTLKLAPMDRESPLFDIVLGALGDAGIPHDTYFCFGNWYLPVVSHDFSQYLASRPSRLQNTLKRARRRFEQDPTARYQVLREPGPALEEAIESFRMLYLKRGRKEEPYPEFIPELCRHTAAKGQLRLGLITLGDLPVAAQIWIVCAETALIFKLAFDPSRRNMSVGTLLTARMLQSAIEDDRVQEIDYLIGDDAYKKDWMTHRRERFGIVAFNPRSANGLAAAARHYAGRQIRRLQARFADRLIQRDTAPAGRSR